MAEPKMVRIPHTKGLVFIEDRRVSGPMLEPHTEIGIVNTANGTAIHMTLEEWSELVSCGPYIRSQATERNVGEMMAAQIRSQIMAYDGMTEQMRDQ